ncbi:Peptidase family M23 [Prauserella marina]|uniref:Peptidase family M23 n=1 Tax=Prauserella marina TaxID=530584 RepID=A0A1G6M9F1_9PSEU|nr:M23 family metallopeptidase [Prauserella marina]PWV85549.1 peptidase M23-like protein [Prauserella marina]SDC52188.1 Peptidase family M23 [Prauserella marina]
MNTTHPKRRRAPTPLTAATLTVLAALAVVFTPAVLAPAGAGQPGRPVADPRFSWPLSPSPVVSRPFDPPGHAYGPGHRGVDLAAKENQEVLAAGAGLVLYAGDLAGRGVVSIEHDGGLRTTYEPVSPRVAVGDQVHQGQVIGTVVAGHAGCATAVCLHWGVRRVTEYLDPLRLVRTGTALRLKPWAGVDAGEP